MSVRLWFFINETVEVRPTDRMCALVAHPREIRILLSTLTNVVPSVQVKIDENILFVVLSLRIRALRIVNSF